VAGRRKGGEAQISREKKLPEGEPRKKVADSGLDLAENSRQNWWKREEKEKKTLRWSIVGKRNESLPLVGEKEHNVIVVGSWLEPKRDELTGGGRVTGFVIDSKKGTGFRVNSIREKKSTCQVPGRERKKWEKCHAVCRGEKESRCGATMGKKEDGRHLKLGEGKNPGVSGDEGGRKARDVTDFAVRGKKRRS